MAVLEILQQLLGRGPPRGTDGLVRKVMLEAVVQGVLKELDLDVGQGILEEAQLALDDGQLVAHQSLALGRDPAEFIVQPDCIEPADSTVVEQFFDLREVFIGLVGQALLFLEGG